jgi:WD repeat-containing protein 35
MLAQRQLYAGAVDAAMKTSLRLMDYDEFIDVKEIYSLIALTSLYNKFYGQASRAFIKLEALDGAPMSELDKYQELAIRIFVKNRPEDPATRELKCPNTKCNGRVKDWYSHCPDCGDHFPACIVTGRALLSTDIQMCGECKHKGYAREMKSFANCPLCHHPLKV